MIVDHFDDSVDPTSTEYDETEDPEFVEACKILSEGMTQADVDRVVLRLNSIDAAEALITKQYERRKASLISRRNKYLRWYGEPIQKFTEANLAIINLGKKKKAVSFDTETARLKTITRKETYAVIDDKKMEDLFVNDSVGSAILTDWCSRNGLPSPYQLKVSKAAVLKYAEEMRKSGGEVACCGTVPATTSFYFEVDGKSYKIGEKIATTE